MDFGSVMSSNDIHSLVLISLLQSACRTCAISVGWVRIISVAVPSFWNFSGSVRFGREDWSSVATAKRHSIAYIATGMRALGKCPLVYALLCFGSSLYFDSFIESPTIALKKNIESSQ